VPKNLAKPALSGRWNRPVPASRELVQTVKRAGIGLGQRLPPRERAYQANPEVKREKKSEFIHPAPLPHDVFERVFKKLQFAHVEMFDSFVGMGLDVEKYFIFFEFLNVDISVATDADEIAVGAEEDGVGRGGHVGDGEGGRE